MEENGGLVGSSLKQYEAEKAGFLSVTCKVSDRILCRAFIIAMIVTEAREVCGAIPVLSFAGDIFSMASKGSSLVLTPNQQAMMLGAVQVAGSALASSVVEKAGRKMLLVITTLVSGLSMCCLASWFLIRDMGSFAPAWIPIVTLCVCIFCDASGLQPVSMVLVGEIVSFKEDFLSLWFIFDTFHHEVVYIIKSSYPGTQTSFMDSVQKLSESALHYDPG
ncbi:hypothetical protein evm_013338 [Chilo suppressalis]|nr:hypothetical protein evm_013338 [Chilo suppressalis]